MRTEAGKMPESLILPIGNESGVSNDRFGINAIDNKLHNENKIYTCLCQQRTFLLKAMFI